MRRTIMLKPQKMVQQAFSQVAVVELLAPVVKKLDYGYNNNNNNGYF